MTPILRVVAGISAALFASAPGAVSAFTCADLDGAYIVSEENPQVWESHRPAEGGAAGKMLTQIIEKAAALKAKHEAGAKPKSSQKKPAARSRVKSRR